MILSQIHLPTLNAILNSLSAVFLTAGYFFIKRGNIGRHRACMLSALTTSTLFLVSYLYYHAHHGATRFQGSGIIRSIYFFILTTHTILAAAIVPLVLVTLYWARRRQFERHARLAHWTWPIWMYVSVTGVVVYWMLYQ